MRDGVVDLDHPFGDVAEEAACSRPPGRPRAPWRGCATWPMNRIIGIGILHGDMDAGRGVGGAGAARHEADARLAGQPALAVGHHRGAAFLAADDGADRRIVQRVEHRRDSFRRARRRCARRRWLRAPRRSVVRRSSCFALSPVRQGFPPCVRQGAARAARRQAASRTCTIGARTEGKSIAVAVVEIQPHAARDGLRIGEHLADRVDRARRHAGLLRASPAAARARRLAASSIIVSRSAARLATRAALVAKSGCRRQIVAGRRPRRICGTGRHCRRRE